MAARSKSDEAFANRLAQHGEELEELFTSLYGDAEALESLRELMNEAHAARPADLKRLDTKRVADPEWYKRGNTGPTPIFNRAMNGSVAWTS